MESKKCNDCGNELSLDLFYNNCRARDGKTATCMVCIKQRKYGYKALGRGEWLNKIVLKERNRGDNLQPVPFDKLINSKLLQAMPGQADKHINLIRVK